MMQPSIAPQTLSGLLAAAEPADAVLLVDVSRQELLLFRDGAELFRCPVSTAKRGFGDEADSFRTPLGWHRICEIIGRDCEIGQVFVSRRPSGDPLPAARWSDPASEKDLILSRILWLDGVEPTNQNSRARYIYLHGTNHETELGTPASQGCIRVGNREILHLADLIADVEQVRCWIGPLAR